MRLPTLLRAFSAALALVVLFVIASLSGAAGRLLGFADWWGAGGVSLLAAALVAGSLLFIKRVGRSLLVKWGGAVAYLTFVCGVAAFSGYKAYTSTPSYVIDSVAIDVAVHDTQGTTGAIKTRVVLKVLKGGLDEVVWGGLSSTGVEQNVSVIESSGGFTSEVMEKAGEWQLRLRFPQPPKPGQRVAFTFSFDVEGSAPDNKVIWVHDIKWPTDKLQISLHVPEARPCVSAAAYSEDASVIGARRSDEHRPDISHNNTEVIWTEANPEEGRSYIVLCQQE